MSYQSDIKQHQPTASQGMQVVQGGNRNAKNLPVNSSGERSWSHGLCGFGGACGTCCYATWCPCMVYSGNKSRYEHLNSFGQPHPDGGESCGGDCCMHALLAWCGFGWVVEMGLRSSVRQRYHIGGGCMGDCCSSFCCAPCELTQVRREIELEERSMGQR